MHELFLYYFLFLVDFQFFFQISAFWTIIFTGPERGEHSRLTPFKKNVIQQMTNGCAHVRILSLSMSDAVIPDDPCFQMLIPLCNSSSSMTSLLTSDE